jgi:hypothetical protein
MTIAEVPSATCQSNKLRKARKSKAPSANIGVTMATILPLIGFLSKVVLGAVEEVIGEIVTDKPF